MLVNARVATRLPARDLDPARRFYSEKLGLEPAEEQPGGLLYRPANGEFALYRSAGTPPGTFTQIAFEVDDQAAVLRELKRRGVVFEDADSPGLRTNGGAAEVEGSYPNEGRQGRTRCVVSRQPRQPARRRTATVTPISELPCKLYRRYWEPVEVQSALEAARGS
jgi:catechol 2,3-dioxygenase-like lactoylglutathione lyase family enzyme